MPNPNLGASRGSYVARVRVRGTYRPKPPLFRAWWPPRLGLGPPSLGPGCLGPPPPLWWEGAAALACLGPAGSLAPFAGLAPPSAGPWLVPHRRDTPAPGRGQDRGPSHASHSRALQASTGQAGPETRQDRGRPPAHGTPHTPRETARGTQHHTSPQPNPATHTRGPCTTTCVLFRVGLFRALGRVVLHRAFCCFCPTYVRSYAPWLGLGMVT